MTQDSLIQQAADLINASSQIVVLTGAGVSKESGVPTFRDALDGLWSQYDPMKLATPTAFEANPKLVWDWYQFRRRMMGKAQPNAGHYALADLETRCSDMLLITQNVDDLHEQAGNKNIIHLHGNISRNKCFYDCQGNPTLVDISKIEWDLESGPPPCPHCGRWVRPDVVWFTEQLPGREVRAAENASAACDLMIVVGTSGLVTPAAALPHFAKRSRAMLIEVNPAYSMITRIANVVLQGPSGEILPRVMEVLG
jgi:NAD-dependent deacetylase